MDKKYKHAEAFALMTYKCQNCGDTEKIWNSRDGVTPFSIRCEYCLDGLKYHINWKEDLCFPNYEPQEGMRIFVDWTKEEYEEHWKKKINDFWDSPYYPMKNKFANKEVAFEELTKNFHAGQPHTIIFKKN